MLAITGLVPLAKIADLQVPDIIHFSGGAANQVLKWDASATSKLKWSSLPFYDVTDHGLVANSAGAAAANSTAIAALLAILPVSGATLFFPVGDYYFASLIDLTSDFGIRLEGPGAGSRASNETIASRLLYTGASGPLLKVNGTRGFEVDHLGLLYTSATYTGILVDCSGVVASTSWVYIHDSRLAGAGASSGTAQTLIKLDNTYEVEIARCTFPGKADSAIEGATVYGDAAGGFATGVSIHDNTFNGATGTGPFNDVMIRAGGEAWTIADNVVEPITAGVAGFVNTTPRGVNGLDFRGNWLGDATSGTYVKATGGTVRGFRAGGNRVRAGNGTAVLYDLRGFEGATLTGEHLNTDTAAACILVDSTTIGLVALGNYKASGVMVSGTPGGRSLYDDGTNFQFRGGQITFATGGPFSPTGITNRGLLNYDNANGNLVLNALSTGGGTTVDLYTSIGGTNAIRARSTGGDWHISGTRMVWQSQGVTGTLTWAPATSNKEIKLPNGSTDFTATGGTSQFLRQNSAGAAIDVVRPAFSDLSGSLPSGVEMAGSLLATAIAAPGTPAAGKGSVWFDSTAKTWMAKGDAGVVTHGLQSVSGAIADDGSITSSGTGGFARITAPTFDTSLAVTNASAGLTVPLTGTTSSNLDLAASGAGADAKKVRIRTAGASILFQRVTDAGTATTMAELTRTDDVLNVVGGYKANGTAGVSAGSFSTITAITSTLGLVTQLTGTSDERLKDIHDDPWTWGLAELRGIELRRFSRVLPERGAPEWGFIAQNVEASFPAAVSVERWDADPTGRERWAPGSEWKTVNERMLLGAAIKGVIQVDDEVRSLKDQIAELTARLGDLESRRN